MQNNNFENCDHVQTCGLAFYGDSKFFMFAPDEPTPRQVPRFRSLGVAQQMTDGTFDFVAIPWRKSQSRLIKKMAHGRVSETKDGAILLTLRVTSNEGINIAEAIAQEAADAANAVIDFQMKR